MKNLIRGHMYQLKKDRFFLGCLVLSAILLIIPIRLSLSLASDINPLMGINGLFDTFLSGDTVLYVFMLLTSNMVAETYRTGVMKNIFGRGVAKKQYCFSIVFTISAAYVLVMLIGSIVMGVLAGSRYGIGGISYPAYYALSVLARILYIVAHISFALTMTIYTRNAITSAVFGLVIPNIPRILEMVLGSFKIHVALDAIKISANMPSVYTASNDLSAFLPCFVVLCAYLSVSVFAGLRLLKNQDIK